jgi:hypothetical protein
LDAYKNMTGDSTVYYRDGSSLPSFKNTPLKKIENIIRTYAWLDGTSYFISDKILVRWEGLVFIFAVIPIAAIRFRGDAALLAMFACVWGVFLCAASVHPPDEVHYRLLIVMAPLFLAIISLAFLDYSMPLEQIAGSLLLGGILVSMMTNITAQLRYGSYRFGSDRVVAVSDLIDAFKHIPYGASVCDGNINWNPYNKYYDRYLDEYVVRRGLQFSEICQPGYYEIVPKFVDYVDIGNGPDAVTENRESYLGYLHFMPSYAGPPVPANTRLIEQTDALSLIVLQ